MEVSHQSGQIRSFCSDVIVLETWHKNTAFLYYCAKPGGGVRNDGDQSVTRAESVLSAGFSNLSVGTEGGTTHNNNPLC